jgi:Mg/Co/Ni transporter MgtE
MFYALSWFVVVALLALWSLAAWALHAVAVWTVSHAGALSGAASGVGAIRLPDWLAPWVPPEIALSVSQLLAGLGPVVDSLLQAAPALAGGVAVATWVVWGIGSALLLMLGAGMHLLIALWRRRGSGGSGPNARPSLAAG